MCTGEWFHGAVSLYLCLLLPVSQDGSGKTDTKQKALQGQDGVRASASISLPSHALPEPEVCT